ncbi:MAG TPA: ComEC/Rec2 family competence protein [Chitinophagaceae bacterium]
MTLSIVPIWKEAPFLRLLPPFITGILLQWYLDFSLPFIIIALIVTALSLVVIQNVSIATRFRLQWITGLTLNLALMCTGSMITYHNQPAHTSTWLGNHYKEEGKIKAVLQEPLASKSKSFKAVASVHQLYMNDSIVSVNGNIILYFSRQVKYTELSYGSTIIINKRLIPVKNSGNPGSFNYQRYCIFNQIAYQVYLKPGDFIVAGTGETRGLKSVIFSVRQQVLNILTTYIKGKQERGLAEALLIGYKDDLDKNLAQSYANTGVIHIIAVSGMHLGIIYWLLSLVMGPLKKKPGMKWFVFLLILSGIWIFSLIAGAGPSVLRSAVMFSFISTGEFFHKRNHIYNNLAASAFLLLCWNPFWLWDAGFQLSYAAVLSIVIFFRPIYNLVYFRNKILDAVWKLNAVTLSAQLLTLPFSLYHFHQFPNLFLPANMIAVPLSGLLLIGEILLCIISFAPVLARLTGKALNFLIGLMNDFIKHINALPFASWSHLQLNVCQAALLLIIITAVALWLMQKSKPAMIVALVSVSLFMCLRSASFIAAKQQRKLIVYNVPQKTTIDFINGRYFYYAGDQMVQHDQFIRNFHLEPSRTLHRVSQARSLPRLTGRLPLFRFGNILVLIADPAFVQFKPLQLPDVIILSNNPSFSFKHAIKPASTIHVVATGSNSRHKITKWKQECEAQGFAFHDVSEKGAFILNIR